MTGSAKGVALLVCTALCAAFAAEKQLAPNVRALYAAFSASGEAPYGVARMKVLYPAASETEVFDTEANARRAPFPVVVFLIGGLVESNRYQWLGERLVADLGVAFVMYDVLTLFGETAGLFADTSGANLTNPSKDVASALDELSKMNTAGVLQGKLDLERIVFGGHSLGGVTALLSARPDLFLGTVGVFTYGVHTAGLGLERGQSPFFPDLELEVPVLLMAGTEDGVIFNAAYRYGTVWKTPVEPVRRTFEESLADDRPSYFVAFDGFNHFAIVAPVERTIGSSFLDFAPTVTKRTEMNGIGELTEMFIKAWVFEDLEAREELNQLPSSSKRYIAEACVKGDVPAQCG